MNMLRAVMMMRVALLLALALLSSACAPMKGKVIAGSTSYIAVVNANDPRLDEAGIQGAVVEVTLDPQTLRAINKPPTQSALDGTFEVSVDEAAGGLQEYDVGVVARLSGYMPATGQFKVPGAGQVVLVVLGDPRAGDGVNEPARRQGVGPLDEPYQDALEQMQRLDEGS